MTTEAGSSTSSKAKKSYIDDFYILDGEEDNTSSKTELDSYLEEKVYPSKLDKEDIWYFTLLERSRSQVSHFVHDGKKYLAYSYFFRCFWECFQHHGTCVEQVS